MAISQITLWKLISGALGVICLLLMATLGILLKNSYTKQSIQPTFSPGSMTELQEVSDCCSCPEKWIGHQCNCYFISNEIKTWNESFHFCASHNSSLLQLQNRDELHFMNSTQSFYWIGLSYSEEHGAWLWEDGSSLNQDLFLSTETLNPKFCVTYNPSHNILDELCENKNYYICKK
ncbi:natural killer cells antigen CD94-like isoform X1 [Sciurus carolinensis]|uniref:natural killer cells antigen CD94-like isoform X1 n=1 Tax=Sciurus carolinensis TaxID=30640 RepID=UPI001FB4C135|nr:natural killer cells antigen CD94-like isoform X1 [Sciurus carolinensis]XP_047406243.1 natural killer cells antigen CD94-like isoform X1 [Sciurus carolinensis]